MKESVMFNILIIVAVGDVAFFTSHEVSTSSWSSIVQLVPVCTTLTLTAEPANS